MKNSDLDTFRAIGLNPVVIDEHTNFDTLLGSLAKAGDSIQKSAVDYDNALAHLEEKAQALVDWVIANEFRSPHKRLLDLDPQFKNLEGALHMAKQFRSM